MFISNSRPSFHLWWKKNSVKHWKVSKYYETDCRIKDVVYVINLYDKESKWTHFASLFIYKNMAVCFASFGIKYISQEILSKINDKSVTYNIFRVQSDYSITCKLYITAFTEYMIAAYTSLLSPNHYQNNDKIIY